jgi:hypothetical protein
MAGKTEEVAPTLAVALRAARLKELRFSEDRPVQAEDFKDCDKREALIHLEFAAELMAQFKTVRIKMDRTVAKAVFVPLILVCGENAQSAPWTTPDLISASYRLLSLTRAVLYVMSTPELLLSTGDGEFASGQIVRWCVEDLKVKLEKDVWKRFPGAQAAFSWLLNQFCAPDLSEFLPEFLPFSLRFIDDWETKNKIRGILCLGHIINNVSSTELRWYGRSELIESTLGNLLSIKDVELALVLLPTYLDFITAVGREEGGTKLDACDRLTGKLLENVEMATDTETRRFYAAQLPPMIELQKVKIVRWQTKFFNAASAALVVQDARTRVSVLTATRKLLVAAGEQARPHARTAFEMLLRLLYELKDEEEDDEEVFSLTRKLLLVVAKLANEEFRSLCDGLEKVKVSNKFDLVIQEAFAGRNE